MKGPIAIVSLGVTTAALIIATLGDTEALFAPKPVSIVGHIFVDYDSSPPATPQEMFRDADAVIVATYTGRHRPIERDIKMEGSDEEFATYIERTALVHTEPLHRDHTYVVFFGRNTARPELYPAWGAGGLYDITGTVVEPVDRERRRYADLTVVAFLERLRRAASR